MTLAQAAGALMGAMSGQPLPVGLYQVQNGQSF